MPSWKSAFHLFGSINSIKTLETDYTFSLVFKSIYFFIGNLVYLLVKDAWLIIGRAFNLSHNCTVQRTIKNNVDFAIFLLNVIHVSHLPNLDLVSIINDKPNYCDLKNKSPRGHIAHLSNSVQNSFIISNKNVTHPTRS